MPDIDLPPPSFAEPAKRSIKAREEEVSANPRARSARLRVAIRTQAPIYPQSADLMPRRAPQSGVAQ
jgi:16S rRNA (cytosine1402-N4)-methyltransferase